MREKLGLAVLLAPLFIFSQVQFVDDFTDSNFTVNPIWTGDTAFFAIDANKKLQLNDTVSNTRYLSAPSQVMLEAEWNVELEFDFNPSSSNYAELYLAADSANLENATTAYFVRIGGSSADRISLYKKSFGNNTLLCESTDDWVDRNINRVKLKIERDADDLWTLSADTSVFQNNMVQLDTVTDNTVFSAQFTGVRCVFTKTRADLMRFDNFNYSGKEYQDVDAPVVTSFSVNSEFELEVQFSEPLEASTAKQKFNYTLVNSTVQIDEAFLDTLTLSVVFLELDPELTNKSNYSLRIENVEDLAGNDIDTVISFDYTFPEKGDVVLNELLIDPSPQIGFPPNALPDREYIELYNRSAFDFDVTDWVIRTGTTDKLLPGGVLPADSFLIIIRDDGLNQLPNDVNAVSTSLSTTALSNSGTLVRISDANGNTLDELRYDISWYHDENKEDGGWSLERIDPDNLCGGEENWAASVSNIGGTPGSVNSILGNTADTTNPRTLRVSLAGDSSITISYNEFLDDPQLLDPFAYEVEPVLDIERITPLPASLAYEIKFSQPIQTGSIYTINFSQPVTDCAGNPLQFNTLQFGKAQPAERGDLVLNEVLFNPYSGGSDYVEIYNRSDKLFDLSQLRLANYVPGTNTLDDISILVDESFIMLPNTYLCLTENPDAVIPFYTIKNPEAIVEVREVPSLPDDEGSIVLLNANFTVIDSLVYTEDLLSPALRDENGVSLERVRYNAAPVSATWYSAASVAGFGTPGYENSQQIGASMPTEDKLSFVSKLFSPNNDGFQDKLEINYAFDKPNYIVTLSVYNKMGQKITDLLQAEALTTSGSLTWDGTNTEGIQQRKGAYVLVLDYFHTDGEKGLEKYAVVLTY